GEREDRVTEEGETDVDREPHAVEDRGERPGARVDGICREGETEGERAHHRPQGDERPTELDDEEDGDQEEREKGERLVEGGDRGMTGMRGAERERGRVQHQSGAQQAGHQGTRGLPLHRYAQQGGPRRGEVEQERESQTGELGAHGRSSSATPRPSSVRPSPAIRARRASISSRRRWRTRSSNGEARSSRRMSVRRASVARACRTAPRIDTKGPYSGPNQVSSSRRRRAARPGLAPPVPIAI